jgi:GTP-binding protein HflX
MSPRPRSGKRTPDASPVAAAPERRLRAAERKERDRGWSHKREAERAILVGVVLPSSNREQAGEHLQELSLLVRTAGAEPVSQLVQERKVPNVRTYIGSGKVEELHEAVRHHEANLVVFDDTLSPAQARNLEKILQINVIDRTEVILDIFARHARSAEAKMQVELAQLQYMRPRLKQLWDHLSRQNGGIGTRGPGETQLEVDRRRVGEKISRLKASLRERNTVASTQRKQRDGAFAAAFGGYTNAGKSSLMTALAGTDLLTENKLFSTLDATTRKVSLGQGEEVLLTDTVGFIRKLPHDLVASFRTTLREVEHADMLLHVVDVTSPNQEEHMQTVHQVLDEILGEERPTQLVFNKIDALEDPTVLVALQRQYPQAHFVSARTGAGLEPLRTLLRTEASVRSVTVEIEITSNTAAVLSFCYREGRVLHQDSGEDGRPRLRVRFLRGAFQRMQQVHGGEFVEAGA